MRCKNYVHFIGPIPNEKILKYYQSSSIFVLLGVGEGMPRSILEAMACGMPVISVPNAGIPDVIKSGENGYLVPNNCPKAIAEKIIILLNDHSKLSDMGLAARMSMKNEFTWNNFIEKLSNLFRSLL